MRQPRLWAFAVLGACAGLAQAPVSQPAALVLGLAGLLYLWPWAGGARRSALAGWLAGLGYFTVTLHWIVEPFLVDVATYGWLAPFALVLMAAGMALFWGAGIWAAARIAGPPVVADPRAMRLRERVTRHMLFALGIAVAEFARAHVLTGFPWADIGQGLIGTQAAWLLPVLGPRGLALTVLLGLAVVVAGLSSHPRKMAAVVAAMGLGLWLIPPPGPVAAAPGAPVVRILQPNAPQHQKWDPVHIPTFYQRQLNYTAALPRPDLVVWPEMAIPWGLDQAGEALTQIAEASGGRAVVLGLPRFVPGGVYNSLVLLGPGGEPVSVYDKHHLVHFGEYMPLAPLAERLGLRGLAAYGSGGYVSGQSAPQVNLPGIGPARALICYEGLFAQEVRSASPRPRLLLLITNDAWFGRFSGPYQHLDQARMRAMELGLPMVRSANTGVSAMIDAHGRVVGSLPLGTAGYLDLPLPTALPTTLYARTGDWFAFLYLILVIGGVIGGNRRFSVASPQQRA